MVLTDSQAIEIVKTNPNKKFIDFLQGKFKVMRAHVTGIGAEALIEQMQGFERRNVVEARKKLMLSNKDLIARLMKPRQKIYTAKGGIESYNLSTSELISDYKEFLSTCAGKRVSLKEFIKQELQVAYDIDPMGLKWIGIDENGEPYPCYKSIMGIYDYELSDGIPEYVVFALTPKEIKQLIEVIPTQYRGKADLKVYRCVCDQWDRIIIWQGQLPEIVEFTQNPFFETLGHVQGEVVSDILCADENGNKYYESPLYAISEILSQYMFGRSIYNIAFAQLAFPIMWMQAQKCPTCNGKKVLGIPQVSGVANHQTGEQKCPECKGSGILPHWQNSDTFIWEFQNDKDGAVPRPPLGVIENSKDSLQYMKDNNLGIEDTCNITHWGIVNIAPNAHMPEAKAKPGNNTSETAFEANLNEEPKRDKQKEYSRWGGNSMKWYVDGMGKLKYGNSYISSALLWGDRYANESPDEILTRITKAKAAGCAQSILQSLHLEYLDAKYENNPLEWRKYWLMYLGEPYFFFQVSEVMTWANIPQIQVLEKQLWGEFICTLNDQIIASIPDDNALPIMQKMIREFVFGKIVEDRKADALLFANDGSQLVIGDTATPRPNKAKEPDHIGGKYKVVNATDDAITLKIGENNFDYLRTDLTRIFN